MTSTLPRKRRTTVPVRRTSIRIAISLLGLAAFAAPSAAQQQAPVSAYSAKTVPWTGDASTTKPAPIAQQSPPVSAYSAKTMPWPGEASAMKPALIPQPQPARTIYFEKQSGPPVYEKAAGLLMPVGADEPLPAPTMPTPGADLGVKTDEMFRLESEVPMLLRVLENKPGPMEDAEARKKREQDNAEMRKLMRLDAVDPTKVAFAGRSFVPHTVLVEPNYVCYGRLLFEDKNTERYGWTYGPIQPLLSAGHFFGRVQWLPYFLFSYPCNRYDCSAGHCLPGDPVPYLIYPPGLSLTGGLAQASVIVALHAIFP